MLQGQAIQKLHHDERLTILLSDFIDCADIRMIKSGSRLRFASKPSQRLGVFGNLVRQEFQGDKSVKSYVLSLVNHTHPPAAPLLDDAVVRDGLADHSAES